MAVKLDNINALDETSTLLKNYSDTIESAVSEADIKFSAKVEGQKAEAIEKYISIMNNLSRDVFKRFPSAVESTSEVMAKYHTIITSEGFKQNVRSSSPEVDDIYCEKLKNTQIPQVTDEANEIKEVLSNIVNDSDISGEISLGNPEKTINEAVSTFDDELRKKITSIKTTRSNLHTANKTFIEDLKKAEIVFEKCRESIENVIAMTDPTNGLMPKDVLKLIVGGDFNAENIEGYINSINAKDDAKAIKYLASGDYESFFKLNPDNLSDGVYATAINDLSKMIEIPSDKMEDLEGVLNALLNQKDEKNMEKHATRLSAMAEMMAIQGASIMHTLDPSSEDYAKLRDKFKKYYALSQLTMTAGALSTPSAAGNIGDKFYSTWFSIENLSIDENGEITFNTFENVKDLSQVTEDNDGIIKIPAGQIQINQDGAATSNIPRLAEKMTELEKKKQDLLDELLKNGIVTAAGLLHPALGLGIGILNNLANKDYSKIKDQAVKQIGGYSNYKDYINGINSIGQNLIDYKNKLDKVNAEGDKNAKDFYHIVLGVDSTSIHIDNVRMNEDSTKGKYGVITSPGIPGVEALENLDWLDKHGLQGYLSEDEFKNLAKDFGTLNDSEKYLLGGSGKTLKELDITQLDNAISKMGKEKRDEWLNWLKKQEWKKIEEK